MPYPPAVVERTMKIQEVFAQAMSGQLTWWQAAEILGWSERTVRRWRLRYRQWGYDGLWDRRRRTPSWRRVPVAEVERILRLYRERYQGFNARHFHEIAQRDHGVTLGYTFVKRALQTARLLPKRRPRGRHRRRREPRPCFGEMLHLDGSLHAWLALCPDERPTLLHVTDDATKQVLYAQLVPAEATATVMEALWTVLEQYGLPQALYTDRAHWAFHTPHAGGRVDPEQLTQVGRALAQLGIEHIPSYSPQARGRSERLNRTFQDRLVNELRVAGVRSMALANRYLRARFLPGYNARFGKPPADPASAFVPLGRVDLHQILCHQEERRVALDNTVSLEGVRMQIDKQPGRRTCAGLRVLARRHLDGTHSLWYGRRCFGRYDARGRALRAAPPATDLAAPHPIARPEPNVGGRLPAPASNGRPRRLGGPSDLVPVQG
jgi:transposase